VLGAELTDRQQGAAAESIAEPTAAEALPPFPLARTLPIAAAATLGTAVALFALQNGSPITLRFLVWAAPLDPKARRCSGCATPESLGRSGPPCLRTGGMLLTRPLKPLGDRRPIG
jgi:hypothetical protein